MKLMSCLFHKEYQICEILHLNYLGQLFNKDDVLLPFYLSILIKIDEESNRMILSEAWNLYKADKQIQGYSSQTLKAYNVQLNLLIRYLGDLPLDEITTDSLKLYLGNVTEQLKAASLGHRIRFIKSLFRWAQDENILNGNPASKIKEPKLDVRIPKFLSEVEIEHLREACHTSLENALFEFMYSTGCRIGETVNLNRQSINFSNQSLIVLGKGNKEREVYFNTRCDICLKRYLEERTDD